VSGLDPVAFAADLIRCKSVTPADDGALGTLERMLAAAGFVCHRLPFSEPGTPDIDNLYARIGTKGPHFCFAGHTDVVPVGNVAGWSVDPFAADIQDGYLYGRGAVDMKGAISAFAAAALGFAEAHKSDGLPGSISFLITGDEEGPSINGTKKVLDWMAAHGEIPDLCLVGEPTNETVLGDMAKIGRRGSVNVELTAKGAQGHVAYPHLADNPIHPLIALLADLVAKPLDAGNAHFQPSSLQVTTVDVANPTENLIPAKAQARLNIRFNDQHSSASLLDWIAGRVGREFHHRARHAFGPGVGRGRKAFGPQARAVDHRRHVGCALHFAPLSDDRVRSGWPHDAQNRRARGRAGHPRSLGDLPAHARFVFRVSLWGAVARPMQGVLRLLAGDRTGLELLGADTRAGWIASFVGPGLLLLPAYLYLALPDLDPDEAIGRTLAVEAIAYVVGLTLFPVAAHLLCGQWNKAAQWFDYVPAYNWAGVLLALALLALAAAVAVQYRIARTVLGIDTMQAFGLVALELSLGLTLHQIADQLHGS
jgi:succinyl-diaminopimelate desuccinylase